MMTARQRQALDFIAEYIRKRGIAPSYDEIMDALGLSSKSGVHRIVQALKERGEIEVDPARARTIRLSSSRRAMKEIARLLAAYHDGSADPRVALQGIQIVVANAGESA